jgi:hypothetical protein
MLVCLKIRKLLGLRPLAILGFSQACSKGIRLHIFAKSNPSFEISKLSNPLFWKKMLVARFGCN